MYGIYGPKHPITQNSTKYLFDSFLSLLAELGEVNLGLAENELFFQKEVFFDLAHQVNQKGHAPLQDAAAAGSTRDRVGFLRLRRSGSDALQVQGRDGQGAPHERLPGAVHGGVCRQVVR